MKDDNMNILKTMILTWTDEQVSEAWHIIAKEGKNRRESAARQMRCALKAGDKVSFSGKAGLVAGTIVRVKRKKAIVSAAGSPNWDVPLSMLRKES
jgi:hypothetical protein